jgi:hypothetical protein
MGFTVQDFDDMLHILEARPEWRRKMVRALFPEIDVPKALQELAEESKRTQAALQRLEALFDRLAIGQERLRSDVDILKTDVAVLKTDVAVLKTDVAVLKTDVAVLKTDVAVLKSDMSVVKSDVRTLKGRSQEGFYLDRADSIFGRYLRKGQKMAHEVADLLDEAQQKGQVTEAEYDQVLAADLLWGGETRKTKQQVLLVMEASWLAEVNDVTRAVARAAVLRKIGLPALPIVGGQEWTDNALQLARDQHVIITSNGSIVAESWQAALAQLQA